MNLRQALAVSIIFLAARLRTPSGSPSPQTSGGQDQLVTLVDQIADRLADEVIGDGERLQAVRRAGFPIGPCNSSCPSAP